MGFGDVVFKYNDLIDRTLKIIENNYLVDIKYKKRITDFFDIRDTNNCKRIYEAINKIGDQNEK